MPVKHNSKCEPGKSPRGGHDALQRTAPSARPSALPRHTSEMELLSAAKFARDAAAHLCQIIVAHNLAAELDSRFNGFGARLNTAIAKVEGKS